MRLVQLIYASRFCSESNGSVELSRIHETAQRNNQALDVTGLLAFGEDRFLQCLEGERRAVNELYSKIVADPRHREPSLLWFSEIDERQFATWSMKLVVLGESNSNLIRAFSSRGRFEPEQMSGGAALRFLMALI